MSDKGDSLRFDKLLWCLRIYKTRSLAAEACQGNKVQRAGSSIKPATAAKIGDQFTVNKGGLESVYQIIQIPKNRLSAKEVPAYLENQTPPERIEEFKTRRMANPKRDRGMGRPTKRERRDIEKIIRHLP